MYAIRSYYAPTRARASRSARCSTIWECTPTLPAEGIELKAVLERLELSLIEQALAQCDNVVARAAELLGVRRTTLVEKMRKYGISRP